MKESRREHAEKNKNHNNSWGKRGKKGRRRRQCFFMEELMFNPLSKDSVFVPPPSPVWSYFADTGARLDVPEVLARVAAVEHCSLAPLLTSVLAEYRAGTRYKL